MSKDKNTRREFIKVISVAPVGALLLNLGCSATSSLDVGTGRADLGKDSSLDAMKKADATQQDASKVDANHDDLTTDTGRDVDRDVKPEVCEPSGSDVKGPFHEPGAPTRTTLVSAGEPGMPLVVMNG